MDPEQAERNCATFLGQGQRRSASSSSQGAAPANALWSLPLLPADVPGEPASAHALPHHLVTHITLPHGQYDNG